ncbi:MAG: algG [Moraxellaceae bacterium]|jgi:poly(beta-D-mannuronate) C5 epimerase|nr:algG [Moraxellaceae bacterium]
MRLRYPVALLLALAATIAGAADAPYRVSVATAPARVDWQARVPAGLADCGTRPPAAPASRSGGVRVINIVKDRYFVKFFNDGRLPRMITQQQDVPRALVVDSGVWRLPELVRAVNDAKVLSTDHVLGLPLLIRPGAVVVVETGDWLKLDRARGAFILNLGELHLRDARVSGWDVGAGRAAPLRHAAEFRPYLLGWGGSRTVIHHSLLESLGFSEHLSNGIGFARGPFGLKDIDGGRPPEAWVTRNRITNAYSAVRISGGATRVCGNVIDGAQVHGVQVEESRGTVIVAGNRVSGVRAGTAISIGSTGGAWIGRNLVEANGQSGIVLTGSQAAWLVGNTVRRNQSDGIRITGSGATVVDNVSSDNGDHGVQVRNGSSVRIQGLAASGNGGVGIEATRQPELKLAAGTRWQLMLADVRLSENRGGAIGMDRPYEMLVGDVAITDSFSARRALLRSALNGVEGPLLKQVLVEKRFVRVAP